MSESTFEFIKRKSINQYLHVLPVHGITVSTALRAKSKKVHFQVLLKFSIANHNTDCIFLVVPNLSTPIILGDDWMTRHDVLLNYHNKTICFPNWNYSIDFRPPDDKAITLMSSLKVRESFNSIYFSPGDQHGYSSGTVIKHVLEQKTSHVINSLSSMSCDREPVENIHKRIHGIIGLSSEEQSTLLKLILEYHSIFSNRPGCNNLYTCRFDVTHDIPFKIRPYPIPFAHRPAVEQELNRMLKWGVIERSSSPYASPIICVKKSDGSVRLCLDARRINQMIIPTRDASPPLDELLARFHGRQYFSNLDFSSGYWQIPLHPSVRKFVSFVYDGRTYSFTRLPFGLNISNTAFGQGLEAALGSFGSNTNVQVYVDDMLISTQSFESHLLVLRGLFEKILHSGMTLKFSKCEFICPRIKFLGHIITPQYIIMDPEKLEAVNAFPYPRNKKELQSFIGFCNFYRKFSDHHASYMSPLTELLKNKVWIFNEENRVQFDLIKSTLGNHVLSHPDFSLPFYIQTDASKLGLGAELFQTCNNERRTISFASRVLNAAERNYSITELELLSVVFACQKFRVFILGYKINVITDHQALVFLYRCRLRNARLTRWTLLLQEYDLHIQHCPGKDNIIDVLSRNPVGRDEVPPEIMPSIFQIKVTVPPKLPIDFINKFKDLRSVQSQDRRLSIIFTKLSGPMSSLNSFYKIYEGVLFYRRFPSSEHWLVCIPARYELALINSIHELYGHVGPKKCISVVKEICIFPNLHRRIRHVVSCCDLCQRAKTSTVRSQGLMQSTLSHSPLDCILVDLYGPLPTTWNGVSYVFVVLDNFSRFVKLYTLKRATALATTNRMIDHYINTYGKPKIIVSDHGVQFNSKIWQSRLKQLDILPTFTSVYHPQSNPAERVMRELGRLFRSYCAQQHTEWAKFVPYIEWVLNHTVHEATGFMPSELFLKQTRHNPLSGVVDFPPGDPIDFELKFTMAREIQETRAEARKRKHDAKGSPVSYKIGDFVLVRTHPMSSVVDKCIHKFFLLYEGPYQVQEIKIHNAYVVSDPKTRKIRGTFNVVMLRPYKSCDI